ncbi:TPA: isoprenylcysteine carboxylmethyltransferase family protein [Mannheimia haemolytica]
MTALKLKIPPPVWFLLCATLMWLVARYLPASLPNYQHAAIFFCGLAVAIIGGAVAVSALWVIHQARTTHSPFRPQHTATLVTWGIYRKSRNPMYLSLLFILMAWALWLGSMLVWLVLPLFVWLITYFQIKPEEQILAQKFGTHYAEYCTQVRRWL